VHRLVIALTTLLAAVAIAVIVAYLFIFGPSADRAANLAPAGSVAYVSVYLTPSSGQQANLGDLLTKLPGLRDRSALGNKIDEITQRQVATAGLDYRADVKPWLGDEAAVALLEVPDAANASPANAKGLVIVAVKDEAAATAGMGRIIAKARGTTSTETYQGITVSSVSGGSGGGGAFAIVDRMLVAGPSADSVRDAIDAAQGRTDSLADTAAFRAAMQPLPGDRVASAYLDTPALASASGQGGRANALRPAGFALVVKPNGLQLVGRMPVDQGAAGASAVAMLGLGGSPGVTSAWMPDTTQAELVLFGAQQGFAALEGQLGSLPNGQQAQQALSQLRGLAALGLGIDLDRDLLPLFDRETAVALQDLNVTSFRGQILLRPSDPAAAQDALTRVADALRGRGSQVSQEQVGGATVTTLNVPQLGQLAFGIDQGTVIVALSAADVKAAINAHSSGATLSAAAEYRQAFELAGGRAGAELYVDAGRLITLLGGLPDLPSDARDILTHVDALALSAPTSANAIEIRATVTVH
jgi:hypothetical protein